MAVRIRDNCLDPCGRLSGCSVCSPCFPAPDLPLDRVVHIVTSVLLTTRHRTPTVDDDILGPRPPVPLTRFVGRANDVSSLAQNLATQRLVTLTGPGGSGKTRLAHAVCDELRGDDDAAGLRLYWVELAELNDPSLVEQAVAAALRVTEAAGSAPMSALLRRLQGRSALLVLDNCEHVVEAAAALIGRMLRACPRLRVLVTSREPIGVAGETTWAVGGLSLPPSGPVQSAAGLSGSEAVALFVDRARLVHPGFRLIDDNADAVARVCRRLDGIPLALELAAARLRILSLGQIVDRLDDVFPVLVTSTRDVSRRHQTLRATLDWSYDLLSEPERRLFARLSVFRGGFTLTAAEAVTRVAHDDSPVLDLLARLVEKSLVQVHSDSEDERWRLLDVVRQYAEQRLDGDRPATATRHASYYLALAELADQHLTAGAQHAWLDRLHREHDNLRAALSWARRHDPQLGIRLASALGTFFEVRGTYTEGREWLQAALAAVDDCTPRAVHAQVLIGLGRLEFLQCEYERAEGRLRRVLGLYDSAEEPGVVAAALQGLGSIAREQGRYRVARSRYEKSLAVVRHADDPLGIARTLNFLSFTAWLETDYVRAGELGDEALRRFRDLGDGRGAAWALINVGAAAYRRGDPARAGSLLNDGLALSRQLGFREGAAWCMEQLGLLAAAGGNRGEAIRLLRESLTIHHEIGDRWRAASVLEALAGELAHGPEPPAAARLLAAATAVRTVIGTPLPPCDRDDDDRRRRMIEAALTPAELTTAFAEGQVMSLDQAVPPPAAAADDQIFNAVPTPRAPRVSGRPSSATLRVHALGRARVEASGRLLEAEDWTYAKPRELLYYLLARPGSTKADIGLALWPDVSAKELRNCFHTAMKYLRRALGAPEWVRFTNGGYSIDRSSGLWYDVDEFNTAATEALGAAPSAEIIPALTAAAGRYPGDFLIAAVGTWADFHREQLRSRNEQVLLILGRLLGQQHRYAEAAETFARLVEYDPFLEVAHRGLMSCHAAMGNRARVVRQYQELVELLASEIGAMPSPETRALYAKLQGT